MINKYDDTGRLVSRIEFDAAEDAAAEAVVSRLEDGRSQELWCGTRCIASRRPGDVVRAPR